MSLSAPPFRYPCYYGTDIDSQDNLIACKMTLDEIAEHTGADSLGYLPESRLGELVDCGGYCKACFSGDYPTEIPDGISKDRFEKRLSEIGK